MKILIIDDDKAIRKMLQDILTQDGYTVITADNGMQAEPELEKHPDIDIVITDIIMPEQEGIETIRKIREIRPLTKIIAISGGGKIGPANYLQLAHAIGAHATLQKPFGKKELLDTLEHL
ncbi:response regulator [Prosthecochloris sp. HL-130-GSB]|jgi:DNA-binding NtrC family response regulator|uniref:response regulator n=1 Tax=Prosthecochloris sp. HL-130-GSB TaxID=1974213 RepID=UPI000A1C1132|nr:response regulator [Prosthecochloris sp. HL-130-GSB]ARM30223.1 response regulator [Prosthecochloris sp. HL-130-GSB]MBO8091827.1 response regulator [Prosthecochloris sp.]